MATKSSLNFEQLDRLESGITLLVVAAVLVFLPSILLMPFTGGLSFLFGVLPLIVLIGLFRIRSVVSELKSDVSIKISSLRLRGEEVIAPEPAAPAPEPEPEFHPQESEKAPSQFGFGSFAMQQQSVVPKQESGPAPEEEPTPETPSVFAGMDWEKWIGQRLLQKVGILIVLIGMIIFLKYSFDTRLIDELGRILLSGAAAVALLGTGEWFQKKYATWSQAFTGGGLALLYFTVWAAHVFYHAELLAQHNIAISPFVAMVLYSFITLIGAIVAIRHNAKTIAWFTVLGGYATPLLISSSAPDSTVLAVYLAILTAGVLGLAWHKKWSALSLAAFGFAQLYLFTLIYRDPAVSDVRQVLFAVGFFTLFAVVPLVHQFRLRLKAEAEDICLILADGIAVFFAVVDGMGGFGGQYVGLVLLALAAVYTAFSIAAMRRRGEDILLVNTYLLSGIGLTALALFAQMKWGWVAAGWAPFSVFLVLVAIRLRRACVFQSSIAVLVGAVLFLIFNLPKPHDAWIPFTSHWALLSYAVLACLIAWIALSERLPKEIRLSEDSHRQLLLCLHGVLAIILFAGVTFEATSMQWVVSLPLALSYLAFSVVAIAVFALTGMAVWLVAAFATQVLVLLFTFLLSPTSGMVTRLLNGPNAMPFFDPWAGVSVLSILAMMALLAVILRRKNHWSNTLFTRRALVFIACAQVWTHITVEIQHIQSAYGLSNTVYNRILSGWWIAFAAALLWRALRTKHQYVLKWAIFALSLPLAKDFLFMIGGQTAIYELCLWTAVPVALIALGVWKNEKLLLRTGIAMIAVTMGGDMLRAASASLQWFQVGWWTVIPLALIAFGLFKKEREMLQVGIVMIIGILLMDLLFSGRFGFFTMSWWTVVPFALIALSLAYKEKSLMFVAIGMFVITIASDQFHTFSSNAGLLRTVWWDVVALVIMGIGFLKREKVLRQFAICIFAGTVVKLLFIDFSVLSTGVRIAASILTGLFLIGASYLYQRFDASLGKTAE